MSNPNIIVKCYLEIVLMEQVTLLDTWTYVSKNIHDKKQAILSFKCSGIDKISFNVTKFDMNIV